MTTISGQSPQFTTLQSALQSSLADKHLDKNELKQLQNLLENTPGLSAETKAGVMQFLDKAHSDSKGHFFWPLWQRDFPLRNGGAQRFGIIPKQ